MERDVERIAADVIDQALQLHRGLGPGLLESVYEMVLAAKLTELGYSVVRQKPVDIEYAGLRFESAFKIDLLVEEKLLIEIKSAERLNSARAKQLLTYLRLTNQSLGLLINFGGETLREGLRSVVNNHTSFAPLREPKSQKR